ncbi:conserved hypothetical protein [Streptomyces griseus subsp. griseus NBRC 13350]|uniref:Integrase n=1 Tax=Streptomyces griseus subsp. griseus (strain JCM 4626 / CBS 651.72 / NBRC 13350 / KCC S-0626 / ISP 5235) TaxID=455632 RepID=B1VP36_STRGG|nr:conserved hypothetical protein [Streptomyces griseus subsp. griseus NBRC 13350]SEE79821.1 hypothetical protein SAMN04490359_5935 [Streptomyces griseus]SQA23230.1 Uncharacterised protein [Streptomyces griseus]
MRICLDTRPGGANPNEDWVAGSPTLAVVLDGLSTVGLSTGCQHGVPWYVAQLGGHLLAKLADSQRSLSDGLADAIEGVAGMHPQCDLQNPGTPSATVAILRQRSDAFDHLVLADSPIVFEGVSGYSVITDLRVDVILPELRTEVERHETYTPEHKKALQELVIAQRQVRNTPEGYWVAAADQDVAEYALTGTTALADVSAAAVMSDGVSRLITEYKMATWADTFELLRAGGPSALIERVRDVEATDPTGRRWPRYKSGDDAAVAFCQW